MDKVPNIQIRKTYGSAKGLTVFSGVSFTHEEKIGNDRISKRVCGGGGLWLGKQGEICMI